MPSKGLKDATPYEERDISSFSLPSEERDLSSFQNQNQESAPEGISKTESGLRGAAQGATLGFGDELSALAEKAIAGSAGALGLQDQNVSDLYDNKTYSDLRDTFRRQNEAAQKANPYSYMGGELAGGLAPIAATAGLATEAAPAGYLSKIGQAAKAGAGYGAASGLGNSKADLTEGDVGGAAADTAKGAAIGAGTGAVLQGAIGALPTSKGAGDIADQLKVAALGGTKSQIQRMNKFDQLEPLADELRQSGAVGATTSREGIQENLEKNLQKYGEQIGSHIDNPIKVSADKVAKTMRDNVLKPLLEDPATDRAASSVSKYIDSFENKFGGQDLSLAQLQKFKKTIATESKVFKRAGDDAMTEGYSGLYDTMNHHVEDALETATSPENLAAFMEAKKGYRLTNNALDMVEGKNAREFANRALSPSDYASGAAGAIATAAHHVNPILSLLAGATTAAANKGMRRYGNQAASSGFDVLSHVLNYVPGSQKAIAPVVSKLGAQVSPWLLNQ